MITKSLSSLLYEDMWRCGRQFSRGVTFVYGGEKTFIIPFPLGDIYRAAVCLTWWKVQNLNIRRVSE